MQNGVEGGNAVIHASGFQWEAPVSGTNITITLSSNCGVSAGCSFSGPSPLSFPTSNATAGTVITYSNPIRIGSTNCNPGSAGLIMR